MSKKQIFINEVAKLIENNSLSADAMDYFNGLKMTVDTDKPKFTPNGKLVLAFMKENKDSFNNLFKSKDIGECMGISSRTVSGAMRKLVTDNYVEKIGEQPIVYALTNEGENVNLDEE